MPDGPRLERQFDNDAPLSNLFFWLDAIADMNDSKNSSRLSYITEIAKEIDHLDVTQYDDLKISSILGTLTPHDATPQIPINFYLSTPYPVQKFERPETDSGPTLKRLGLVSDVALFLHHCVPKSTEACS